MGGNPLIAFGVIGRWDGERTGISSFETFDDLMNGDDSPFKDCEIDHIWDENGILKMRGHHHDGGVEVEIRQLTDHGCEALESYEQSWAGEPFDAAGRHYDGGKESGNRIGRRWSAWAIEQIGTLYGTPGTPSSADAVPGFPIFGASNDSSPTR